MACNINASFANPNQHLGDRLKSDNMAVDASIFVAVKRDLLELILTKKCNPLMTRLAWHDSGTFDKV